MEDKRDKPFFADIMQQAQQAADDLASKHPDVSSVSVVVDYIHSDGAKLSFPVGVYSLKERNVTSLVSLMSQTSKMTGILASIASASIASAGKKLEKPADVR